MLEAGMWGLVGGASLLIGALLGLALDVSQRAIGLIMAFGSGVLISALAFELTEEASVGGGTAPVVIGLGVGGLAFFLANLLVEGRGGAHRKRSGGEQSEGSGLGLAIGAVMDGVPESVAIGASLIGGGGVGVAVVAAVFLSNLPESLAAATGMRKAGYSSGQVIGLWSGVMAVSGLASLVGFALLGGASPVILAVIQAFAAGAILAMLADTMMPEAFENGGRVVGLVTVAGFAAAFALGTFE
jgi:ZIP family zinc transporter